MSLRVVRPPASFNPGKGLFRSEHFQVAYVTNDLPRAVDLFRDRYRITEFLQIELQQSDGPGSELFNSRLPADGFAIQMHHLGYLIHDQAEWDALLAEVERSGRTLAFRNAIPGLLSWCFVEAPELGHYLEYIFPEPEGVAFLQSIPAS
jgi:hypothetical protein